MSSSPPNIPVMPAPTNVEKTLGWQGETLITSTMFAQILHGWYLKFCAISDTKIALYLSDSIDFSAALFAAWRAEKTVFLVADTLESNCRILAQEVGVFVGEFPLPYRADLQEIMTQTPDVDAWDASQLLALDAEFPALVVTTSGSTGEAQMIPKKWSQLLSEIVGLESQFGEKLASATIYSTVSHHHIYGLLFKVLWPLFSGRPITAHALCFPEQMQLALSSGPSVLISSPAHLKRMPEHLNWLDVRASLCAVFSSGGPLHSDSVAMVKSLWGKAPIEVYGSSETGGIAWRQRQASKDESWQAFPSVEWRVTESDHLLEVRSPHLPNQAWLRLADRVNIIDERHFHLLGRQDRIVKIEEKRISLDLMERALLASELVNEVRLVVDDTHDDQRRQRMSAFVVLSDLGRNRLQSQGKHALNQSLRAILSTHVEAVALPRRWRYLAEFPVNSQGKVVQAQLLALLEKTEVGMSDDRPTSPQWRVLEEAPERILLELIAPKDLLFFQGHFPVFPLLPGVVQVDWAIQFGRQFFTLPMTFKGMQALKFQQVILPEKVVFLELIYQCQKKALQFRYFSDSEQHAGGRILFD